MAQKRTRRRRGSDGILYTAEEYKAKFESGENASESQSTEVKTPEHIEREKTSKPPVQEKAKKKEKDTAPSLIISYIDSTGRRQTKSYQCGSIKLDEFKQTEMMRSGPKTTLHLTVEADVVEVL